MEVVISPSNRKDKKFKAVIDNKKTVHFGASGYSDYTLNKNNDIKDRYIQRNKKKKTGMTIILLASTPSTFCGTNLPHRSH